MIELLPIIPLLIAWYLVRKLYSEHKFIKKELSEYQARFGFNFKDSWCRPHLRHDSRHDMFINLEARAKQ